MKAFWAIPLALALGLVVGSESVAQFGRPTFVPRFSPPPRFTPPPRFVPPVPVTPHPNPGVPRTPTMNGPGRNNAFSRALFDAEAFRAATTVGLLASPMGQGPLLDASAVAAEQTLPGPALNPVIHANFPSIPNVAPPVNTADSSGPDSSWFWILAVVGIGALVIGIGKAINGNKTGSAARTRVRIVSTPPGEAPRWIREAWIGLELPFADGESGRGNEGVFGVLSQRMAGNCDGYAVNGAEAVRLLAAKDREAAEWWRSNASHVLVGGYQLIFPAAVCEEMG